MLRDLRVLIWSMMNMMIGISEYNKLWEAYNNKCHLTVNDTQELFQFLLDTDLIFKCNEQTQRYCRYLVMEGLCYEVGYE